MNLNGPEWTRIDLDGPGMALDGPDWIWKHLDGPRMTRIYSFRMNKNKEKINLN